MEPKSKISTTMTIVHTGLFIALFAIAILALVFSLSDIDCDFLKFSSTGFREIMGVFVSAVALVITAYFVILAIDGYSSIQEIKKVKEIVEHDINHLEKKKEELSSIMRDYSQSLYDDLEAQIELAEKSKSIKLRNDLLVKEARMSYHYPMLDKKIRIVLLSKLYDIGDVSDIYKVQALLFNPDEDNDIKDYATLVVDNLKQKYGLS
jgi:hypothetical protein